MSDFAKQLEHIGKLIDSEQDMKMREAKRKILKQTLIKLELMNRGKGA